jgi:hypothetical protein
MAYMINRLAWAWAWEINQILVVWQGQTLLQRRQLQAGNNQK